MCERCFVFAIKVEYLSAPRGTISTSSLLSGGELVARMESTLMVFSLNVTTSASGHNREDVVEYRTSKLPSFLHVWFNSEIYLWNPDTEKFDELHRDLLKNKDWKPKYVLVFQDESMVSAVFFPPSVRNCSSTLMILLRWHGASAMSSTFALRAKAHRKFSNAFC